MSCTECLHDQAAKETGQWKVSGRQGLSDGTAREMSQWKESFTLAAMMELLENEASAKNPTHRASMMEPIKKLVGGKKIKKTWVQCYHYGTAKERG